jgi:hypothetical protein
VFFFGVFFGVFSFFVFLFEFSKRKKKQFKENFFDEKKKKRKEIKETKETKMFREAPIRDFVTKFCGDAFKLSNDFDNGRTPETFEQRSNALINASQEFFDLHSFDMDDTCKLELKCWQFWLLGFILGQHLVLEIENSRCMDMGELDETEFMTYFFDEIWILGMQHKQKGDTSTFKARGNKLLRESQDYLNAATDLTKMQIIQIKCRQHYLLGFLQSQNMEVDNNNIFICASFHKHK